MAAKFFFVHVDFHYSFFYLWTSRLIPYYILDTVKSIAVNADIQVSLWYAELGPFRYIPRS